MLAAPLSVFLKLFWQAYAGVSWELRFQYSSVYSYTVQYSGHGPCVALLAAHVASLIALQCKYKILPDFGRLSMKKKRMYLISLITFILMPGVETIF